MKHFKLTNTTKVNAFGIKLFQIELTIDCKWGKKGDLGGWVEKESNVPIESVDDGYIYRGEIWGDAVIRGGVIRGGVIWGGVIWGGVIRGDNTVTNWLHSKNIRGVEKGVQGYR